jgi:hypothetical protein
MKPFAEWLSTTAPSVFIQEHNAWAIPLIQSIHIVGISAVSGSAFLIILRILGLSAMDQTLQQVSDRYWPWVKGSLYLLLVSGLLMVVGEPARELVSFSFWAKMFLVAVGAILAFVFQRSSHKGEPGGSAKGLAIFTFAIWVCIIFLGRLIAYDHIWGSWSPGAL